ncbi:MAG: vitamin K epoxide reductase family protein [Cyanobacteriota bacterium]|nr:vitamin K epoxide reductase family protein [Cyanobacteriota bacterium]
MTASRLSERLNSQRRRPEAGPRWVRVVMAVLATIGVIDTGSITLSKWGLLGSLSCSSQGFFGCNGCDKVLSSAWGSVFGQPLSLVGFLAYGAMLLLALIPLVSGSPPLQAPCRWGAVLLSTGMAVFSLVLLGVMAFAIRDCCPFCILSAALSLALFVLSVLQGDWADRGQLLFRAILVALVVGLIGLGWATAVNRPAALSTRGAPLPVTTISTPSTLALAERLTASGAVMYSAYWCPHCHEQKELFGKEAAARLKVIECAPDGQNSQAELCKTKAIQGYPSWEINGQLDSGVKPLQKLANLIGYDALITPAAPAGG